MSSEHTPSKSNGARYKPDGGRGGSSGGGGSKSTWKQLPGALIEGVRHRFRDRKQSNSGSSNRSKSPEWDWRMQNFAQLDPDPGGGGLGGCLPVVGAPGVVLPHNGGGGASSSTSSYTGEAAATNVGRADTLPRSHHNHHQVNGVLNPPPLIRSNSTGTNASVTSSDYGFQDWGSAHHPRAAVLQAMRPRKQGKSVRFGENRISVFMQDPSLGSQALEEVVKLALGYAEQEVAAANHLGYGESGGGGGGGTLSDTEAVTTLSRSSGGDYARGAPPPAFWSDSERAKGNATTSGEDDEGDEEEEGFRRGYSAAAAALAALQHNPAQREAFFSGTNGSSLLGGPSPTTNHHHQRRPAPTYTSSNGTVHHRGYERLKHRRTRRSSSQMNEIFTIFNQILNGGDVAAPNPDGCFSDSEFPRETKREPPLPPPPPSGPVAWENSKPPLSYSRVDHTTWSTTTSRQTSSCSTSSCSYRPSNSSSQSSRGGPMPSLTPEEALEALQTLTRLSSKTTRRKRLSSSSSSSQHLGGGGGHRGAFSDSDCDDDNASVLSAASRRSVRVRASSSRHHHRDKAPSPSAAMLMTLLNERDNVYPRSSSQRPPRRRAASRRTRPSADMFATILLCSEENAEYSQGVPMYKHLHSKITQDVCNAIFLCKV